MINMIDKVLGKNRTLKHITRDSDRDNVPNIFDCKPYDPKKQGLIHDIGAKLARKAGREELAGRIEKRGEQIDKDRAEVRQAQRESFQKERLIVARERGKRRARPGTSFRGFVSGIARTSPMGMGYGRTAPIKKGKKKTKFVPIKGKPGQFRKVTTKGIRTTTSKPKTIRDVLGGNIPKFF